MNNLSPTMRVELKRRSRPPFWLLMAAVIGVGGVVTMVGTSHGRDLTQVQIEITIAILSVSVPMLLAAVLLSQRVKCPKCKAVLGFKTRVESCPSCKVRFDEPMPSKLMS